MSMYGILPLRINHLMRRCPLRIFILRRKKLRRNLDGVQGVEGSNPFTPTNDSNG